MPVRPDSRRERAGCLSAGVLDPPGERYRAADPEAARQLRGGQPSRQLKQRQRIGVCILIQQQRAQLLQPRECEAPSATAHPPRHPVPRGRPGQVVKQHGLTHAGPAARHGVLARPRPQTRAPVRDSRASARDSTGAARPPGARPCPYPPADQTDRRLAPQRGRRPCPASRRRPHARGHRRPGEQRRRRDLLRGSWRRRQPRRGAARPVRRVRGVPPGPTPRPG
jgi:hypothetical protein